MIRIEDGPCLKVLVAYYSYSGKTRKVAQALREKTCGVLYGLETRKQYASRTVVSEAKRELEQRDLPELKHAIPSMAAYDVILVGGPVWWYTVSAPLMSFLRGVDFAGGKVAAFCTHEGGVGSYFADFRNQAENADLLGDLAIHLPKRKRASDIDGTLDAWLSGLGLPATQSRRAAV